MTFRCCSLLLPLAIAACASDTPRDLSDPSAEYEELIAATVIDAPAAVPGTYAPENRFVVERGEYLVELLGCGSCHTDGALEGAPRMDMFLAGSRTGIAWMNPFQNDRPGVIYPPNLTPDAETGIGEWSDEQIAVAIRAGIGQHQKRRLAVMPWQGYAKIDDEDIVAIVSYLRSIKPVRHEVPREVRPGVKASHPFVYFGVYRSR